MDVLRCSRPDREVTRAAPSAFAFVRLYWAFAAVVVWKWVLVLGFALPVPANDAFFFDGAVINGLQHGLYANPSIAPVFPVNATELFFAYPPGYQAVLAGWMAVFGTSVLASLSLHAALFTTFAGLALAVLRRFAVGPAAANFGALFLFGITFHDRPDGLAQVLGLAAFWLWARPGGIAAGWRRVVAVGLIAGTVGTSLHIGAMYGALLWAYAVLVGERRFGALPGAAMLAMGLVPLVVAAAIFAIWPMAWVAFQENVVVTPAFTGLRWPAALDAVKVARTAPGILVVLAAVGMAGGGARERLRGSGPLLAWLLATLGAVAAALFLVAPTYVWVAAYGQVLVVAWAVDAMAPTVARRWGRALGVALGLVGLRAAALTTWGVYGAMDCGRAEAEADVRAAVEAQPTGASVIVSSAYLYGQAEQTRVAVVHSDWPGDALTRTRLFVLTRFDYHRAYEARLNGLLASGAIRRMSTRFGGQWVPPDASPRWQRVVQHLSWAPVLVSVEWAPGADEGVFEGEGRPSEQSQTPGEGGG